MAFLPNIPQPTDQLSISQGNILNNFTILGAIAGNTNASSGSINASSGFNWIYLPTQGVGATPPAGSAFAAGQIGLYVATNPTTTINELYINKTNQATVVQVPMTASTLSTASSPLTGTCWTYLPSGLIIKCGQNNGVLSGLTTVTISSGGSFGPAFTRILNVMVCPANGTSTGDLNFAVRLIDINGANTFRIYISSRTSTGASSGPTGFQFIAIGF